MSEQLFVYIDDAEKHLGTLYYDRQGAREHSAFAYADSWLEDSHRFSIDPELLLVRGPQFHHAPLGQSIFHGAIADTEPDGWGRRVILRDHAKRRNAEKSSRTQHQSTPLGQIDFLLSVDDFSRVGSLRFKKQDGPYLREAQSNNHGIPPIIELEKVFNASRAFEANTESAADLQYLLGRGTSLGGLRPKSSVIDVDGSLAIGKFPSISDERAVTKAEVLALTLAAKAGINAAAAKIVSIQDAAIAVIRRFDRDAQGKRTLYVSAATMLGASNEQGEHSYTEIVDAIRQHGAQPQKDLEELWRRIAFSILITNVDDHLHNHGFLYAGDGHWRLAPAFDINPFPERQRELKLWISEQVGPEATIEGLMSTIAYFRIAKQRAHAIIRDVESAVSTWQDTGMKLGLTKAELLLFEDAFEHKEREAARELLRGSN